MEIYSSKQAYENLSAGVRRHAHRIPTKSDAGYFIDGGIFPSLAPRFDIKPGARIFTIGSCFARNIEEVLVRAGMDVPVAGFRLPEGELPLPGPQMLNEFNAGTMLQRLENVFGQFHYDMDKGVEETPKGYLDLFLQVHQAPVTLERLQARRAEIDALYQQILSCDVVIMTLGLVECWYDNVGDCYLNKAPGRALVRSQPDRFSFHRFGVEDVFPRLQRAIELINSAASTNILLTVSPVPIQATFTDENAVMANSYSKAVLRVAAEQLYRTYPNVDYFPSFEIVQSLGAAAFQTDNVHVEGEVVERVTRFMITHYGVDQGRPPDAPESAWTLYKEFLFERQLRNESGMLEIASRIAATYPDSWFGHDALSLCAAEQGDVARAIGHARTAISLDPDNWGLWARLGNLLEAAGEMDEAENCLLKASEAPNGEPARAWLADLQERRKSGSALSQALD